MYSNIHERAEKLRKSTGVMLTQEITYKQK